MIYVVRVERTGRYKVGYTAWPQDRVYELGASLRSPVVCVALMPGDIRAERALHKTLVAHAAMDDRGKRLGEQYDPTPGFLAWLDGIDRTHRVNVRRPYPMRLGVMGRHVLGALPFFGTDARAA